MPGVKTLKPKKTLFPPWNMPSDPMKAVLWFSHWLLRVAVRFFWIPVIAMIILEVVINWQVGGVVDGIIGGSITLLVGLVVWAILGGILLFLNISTGVSQVLAEAARMQQTIHSYGSSSSFGSSEAEGHVVEGTITDLEEERRKRRADS